MRLLKFLALFALFATFLLIYPTSCTFNNEEDLLKDFQCDSTNISYDDLTYIFTGICTDCHSEVFTYHDEIKMDTYENVKSSINTDLVWPVINHADGVPAMPNGLPKLSDCDIRKIEVWTSNGMPEI